MARIARPTNDIVKIRRQLRLIDDPMALLEGVFAHAPMAIQIFKSDGRCLLVNRAFRELFGSEPPPKYDVFRDEDAANQGLVAAIHRAFAGETVTIGPTWYDPRRLGKAPGVESKRVAIEVVVFPLVDASGSVAHVALTFKDVTAEMQLRAERERLEALNRTEDQLRQAQKLEAIGKLAGGIAHDFNNLLSVIISYSTLAVETLKRDHPVRADLEEVKRAGERAADLTKQLLAFSRQQVLVPKIVNLGLTLTGMEKMLRRLLAEDINLSIVAGSRLGSIRADPGQLDQLIMNLVINARDAMPSGGRLTVEAINVDLDAKYTAEHLGASPGPHVMLAVSDEGVGMDAPTRSRVFEPFFTTKEKGKGTGLGLSTVLGIVQQSGGSIWVDSEVGHGTSFRIYFPRVPAAEEGPPLSVAPMGMHVHGTETILLVEDEEPVRVLARTILRRHGYQVLEAQNGGEAFLICEQHASEIHLLLTDVVMPRMSGRQLAKRLVPLRPGLKILYMSGYTDDSIFHHGVLDPGTSFLQKPITPSTLVQKVREVLDLAVSLDTLAQR